MLMGTLFTMAVICGALLAQDTPSSTPEGAAQPNAAPAQASSSLKIAPGSVIPVQLSKTVDAKKAKTGDEVMATVMQDMKTNSGDVLVPKDTRILGHVTEAQARNKDQKASELGIAFDQAVVKGDRVQLPMSIQAVIVPQPANPAAPDAGGAPGGSGRTSSSPMAGRTPLSGSSPASQPQSNYPPAEGSSASQSQTSARPPINGNTQGVIGMPDVKLETTAQNAAQGSLMTSEKNNVKIEKGTMMLLRVN